MRLIFASNNKAKTREMAKFTKLFGFDLVSYVDVLGEKLSFPAESTTSQEENAKRKAVFIHEHLPNEWVLADDTGFFLEAFPDRFGVTASREFGALGLHGNEEVNDYLLDLYKDIPDEKRGAYFLSTMALCSPEGKVTIAAERGGVRIARELHPGPDLGGITDLLLAENGKSLSEMPVEEAVAFHDRGRTFKALIEKAGLNK